MMKSAAAVLAAALIGSAGPALAQSMAQSLAQSQTQSEGGAPQSQAQSQQPALDPSSPPADDRRYTFHRMHDGYVRLDSQTGQVAQCGWGGAGWTCTVAPDERAALEAEMARVRTENAALKKELLARGLELPAGVRPEPPQTKVPDAQAEPRTDPKLPAEAEIDRAFNFMKDVWRRLIEMMAELQRDIQKKS